MTDSIVSVTPQNIEQTSYIEGYFNTFDLNTYEGKIKTLQATSKAKSLKDHEGEILQVTDAFTMQGVRKGRNGMPDTPCQNTYIITGTDDNGEIVSYFTQSDGIARDINMFAAMFPDFGKNSPKGYVEMVVTSEVLPNGNTLKHLTPVM